MVVSKNVPVQPEPLAQLQHRLASTRLVIFDFDGVVADSEVLSLRTLRDTLHAHGVALSLQQVREKFLGASLATITEFAARHHSTGFASDAFATDWQATLFAAFRAGLQPATGLVALLDRLQAHRLPFCIASSSTHERIRVALATMQLSDRFPHIFSAQDVALGKPAPDLFLHAAKCMKIAPADCLVIEDSPLGIAGATAAGMDSVGFVGGSHLQGITADHADRLQNAGAGWILQGHDTVINLLSGAPAGSTLTLWTDQ